MTATSLVAAAQSSFDPRLPVNTSTLVPSGQRPRRPSILVISLEGLTKHRKLRNPQSSRFSMTRDPMKPAAPVTRIGSPFPPIGEPHSPLPILSFSHTSPPNPIEPND